MHDLQSLTLEDAIARHRGSVLGDLPANTRTALSHLADFFNTPVEQPPA